MTILLLSLEDAFRSRLSEGFLGSFHPQLNIITAGTRPLSEIHLSTDQLLYESFIMSSKRAPQHVEKWRDQHLDYLLILCEQAEVHIPQWLIEQASQVRKIYFPTLDKKLRFETDADTFRKLRDTIKQKMFLFFKELSAIP